MIIQYIIIAIILAACITYVAICVKRELAKVHHCHSFHCAGCAFYDKCKSKDKK